MNNFGFSPKSTTASALPVPTHLNDDTSRVDSALSSETYDSMPSYPGSSIEPGSESDENSDYLRKLAAEQLLFQRLGEDPSESIQIQNAFLEYESMLEGGDPDYFMMDEAIDNPSSSKTKIVGSSIANGKVQSMNTLRINSNPPSPSGNLRMKPIPNAPNNRLPPFWKSKGSPTPSDKRLPPSKLSFLKGYTGNWNPDGDDMSSVTLDTVIRKQPPEVAQKDGGVVKEETDYAPVIVKMKSIVGDIDSPGEAKIL